VPWCALPSWEDRFGARLLEVGFADIKLLAGRPPADLASAQLARFAAQSQPAGAAAPARFAAWQRDFDHDFHWEHGWRSAEVRDRWARQAAALAADVRAELGTRAELSVRLWPLQITR
jgi:hypothetical protein